MRWHSSVLDVRSVREFDCGTDHCLVIAEFSERWTVSKQDSQTSDVERFNFGKLNELEVRIKVQNRSVASEKFGDSKDMNRVCKNIKGNIKT
jgi:hypothetical protein